MPADAYTALRSDAAAVDLSARGKLRVAGDDRARLLHAMSTNHVEGLKDGAGVYAFFLTAQGRILADSYIYNCGKHLFLDTEPELGPKLLAHLDKYIIADDVELVDESETWAAIGIEGPASLELARKLEFPVPEAKYGIAAVSSGGFVTLTASSGGTGVRVFLPANERDAFLERLVRGGIPVASAHDARVVRLENGIPRYGEDITERYLVQETGLLHGVHANKGCYVGQEIVERVRSRAQVHRNLRALRVSGTNPPAAGSKLVLDGKEVGELTSAEYSPALTEVVALGYIRTEFLTETREFEFSNSTGQAKVRLAG